MTCIRDRPLSELPTIEDFDQILEDLHAESNDWDTASAHLRNAYKENGKTPPEIEIEKPTSIIEFTYDGKRESFDFADIKQKRTEWGIFREGLKELAPVVTGIASQTNIEYSLTEWNNYYVLHR